MDQRLVTLTGTGGTGKTRLALQVAHELLDSFPDGVFLVELAPLSDPDLVPQVCVKVLNMIEPSGISPTDSLVYFLEKKDLLLILDNCEHLITACASLADALLKGCPRLHILATSREILSVPGEHPYRVPSLEVPDLRALPPLAELAQVESVRLFIERAGQVAPGAALTSSNAGSIARIGQRLDGIPLAIELAAARMRLMTAEQIAERLDDAYHLLTGGGRTVLHRHQTLKALIDWSYDLLSPKERLLLQRLSVFAGGWTLEAAEMVCADQTGEPPCSEQQLASVEIMDLLALLVDKSLVIAEPGARESRYRMLETIRQYARERLLETGGGERMHDRHLAYFLQLAEQAEPHLRAWGMVEWLERLETELDNLRLALEWSLANDVESGLRLGAALEMFWHIRGYSLEGNSWLEELLAAEEALHPAQPCPPHRRFARARALLAAAYIQLNIDLMIPEGDRLRQARAIFVELGDQGQKWVVRCDLCLAATQEEFQACLEASQRTGDKFTAEECMMWLSQYRMQEFDPEGARAIAEELLPLCREVGDMDGEAYALWRLGETCLWRGDLDRAAELWRASQACFVAVGNKEWVHWLSICLVRPLILRGKYRRAIEQLEALLALGRAMRGIPLARDSLDMLAWAAWNLKDYDQVQRWVQESIQEGFEPSWYLRMRLAISRGDYAYARVCLEKYKTFGKGEKARAIQALGILAAVQQQERCAAVLFGALDRKCSWLKNISSPAERDEYEQALAAVRAALGAENFQAAWAEGQAMDQEQAAAWLVSGMQMDGE